MKPPSDEELILHYYGEAEDPDALEAALEDPEVEARWRALKAVLDAVPREIEAPERESDYGERVWSKVEARMEPKGRLLSFPVRPAVYRWAAAAVILAALGSAFWLGGRLSPQTAVQVAGPGEAGADSGPAGEAPRVLLLAVSEHLGRTEMLLAELANPDGASGAIVDREWAGELTRSGRLYRQAAERSGARGLALLLRELEPVLVELAHGPDALSAAELAELNETLLGDDVLFKVRIVGSRLKNETHPGAIGADV